MTPKSRRTLQIIWKYLNQPILDSQSPLILNPHRFWHAYKIKHLERCWNRTYRPEERYRN